MYKGNKIVVVLPAYNAASTLERTVEEIPMELVDDLILCDDASTDETVSLAKRLGINEILQHQLNRGYGANQKSLYDKALSLGADIIIMLHPDYQYTPRLIGDMVRIIGDDVYPVVLGSRILGNGALKGGMPVYKYISNRILTLIQNMLIGSKLSEFHTGYRAYHSDVLKKINNTRNSDDFVFDNQVLSQIIYHGYDIGEVTCPTHYFDDASSISFTRSVRYGIGVLRVSVMHFLQRTGLGNFSLYS